MTTIEIIRTATHTIETMKTRSAWMRGVKGYALELIDDLETNALEGYVTGDTLGSATLINRVMLNGAKDWKQYSWGGSALAYDEWIASRLCTPSELKRTKNGQRKPNASEEWLDVQARALYQAAQMVIKAVADARLGF